MLLEFSFWLCVFIVFYVYFGFFIFAYIISKIKGRKSSDTSVSEDLPEITLFIAAYNERDFVKEKMENTRQLQYPKDKLTIMWVTDGSNDGTPNILREYPENTVLHEDARRGKIGAMNRGMSHIKTPIVVFCDANTYLNKECLLEIVSCFKDQTVGCVAGEKRIFSNETDAASGSGEGFYWKFESKLKEVESDIWSTVGAAGELFAVRTSLLEPVFAEAILDDFVISMRIAHQGYKVRYCPKAYATETSSANVTEELKRKIRIAAGGLQSVVKMKELLYFWQHPWLSFSYFSHKVLRWTALPICFILAFFLNIALILNNSNTFYYILMAGQLLFYILGIIGWWLQNRNMKIKVLFVPYYLLVMNYAILAGIVRYLRGKHSVNWARAQRKTV